jgi:hypothetical protein
MPSKRKSARTLARANMPLQGTQASGVAARLRP